MVKQDTYLVINKLLTPKFKTITYFKYDLGKSLINDQLKFSPHDVNIQKHLIFFDTILLKIGDIGNLKVYTNNKIEHNKVGIYNADKEFLYDLDNNLSMYDNINTGLDLFFNKYEKIEKDIDTSKSDEITKEKYVKPNKDIKEMSEEERILFARNR